MAKDSKHIRIQGDYRAPFTDPKDKLATGTDETVYIGRGEDVVIEHACLDGANALFNLQEMASLTLELKSLVRGQYAPAESATALAKVIVPASSFEAADFASWTADTAQQASFVLTAAQTNNCPAGQLLFAIYATSNDNPGKHVDLLVGKITIVEDGVPSSVAAESVDGTGYTKAESDTRYAKAGNLRQYPSFYHAGAAILNAIFGYLYVARPLRIHALQLFARDAPTGAAINLDIVDADGSTLASVASALGDGETVQRVALSTPLDLDAGDVARLKWTQVGSNNPGYELEVRLEAEPRITSS